ncbi:MAG TPA: zinc-ribbon domain-containing protein, partial [Candidatus Olsenella pullicola]|nr:zinc-ribbon domain-containing protein [Candidatus Olsenella pullicola]
DADAPETAASDAVFCSKCGAKNVADAGFCSKCGAKLN